MPSIFCLLRNNVLNNFTFEFLVTFIFDFILHLKISYMKIVYNRIAVFYVFISSTQLFQLIFS